MGAMRRCTKELLEEGRHWVGNVPGAGDDVTGAIGGRPSCFYLRPMTRATEAALRVTFFVVRSCVVLGMFVRLGDFVWSRADLLLAMCYGIFCVLIAQFACIVIDCLKERTATFISHFLPNHVHPKRMKRLGLCHVRTDGKRL